MAASSVRETKSTFVLASIIIAGVIGNVALARQLDSRRVAASKVSQAETLYIAGETARRLSLGFNGLVADWYWMRTLQYVGNKVINAPEDVALDDLSTLDLKLLAPLLDAATTLDPKFLAPYEYAAIVLPGVNISEAVRITSKGIAANPNAWRLFQHLGYIYWQQANYLKASETYAAGAKIQGAPPWMEAMSARMAAEGGSRGVARELYWRLYENAADEKIKEMAARRLLQLESLDERDQLRQLLVHYKLRNGRCPTSWKEMETRLRALNMKIDDSGAPLDPTAIPYMLNSDRCEVELGSRSGILPY